jgi:hypothetical protein
MSNKSPILIILKPEVFDTGIIRENPEIFLENTVLPDPNILLKELFLGIITEYE